MPDYLINPVLMRGLVKEAAGGEVKVHLPGRLGVLTVPRRLVLSREAPAPGREVQFYFSYLEVDPAPREYDLSELKAAAELLPIPVGGTLTEVNDTAVKCALPEGLGTVAVPRRWVFTNLPLEVGQTAGFYLSPMKLRGEGEAPIQSIESTNP